VHIVSQIIEKNLHRREACVSGLWINPEKDDLWRKAKTNCASLKLVCQEFGAYRFLQQTGAEVEFSAFPEINKDKYKWIILNLPRQKALLCMMLDCAASLLAEDGVLWLAGENKAGIKSADKFLKLHFGQVKKLDNARHCALYEAEKTLTTSTFNSISYRQEWQLTCKPAEITITSYPGVFAHGRLDAGTALLLETLAALKPEGDILDFACGAGLIGACISANHPHTSVTLLDCEETLAANRLAGSVLASDGLTEIENSFDFIISNPPIHASIKTDSRLSLQLLESAHDHIRPGGMLVLVANIHLPYENWLSQKFRQCIELSANKHFKVIAAKK